MKQLGEFSVNTTPKIAKPIVRVHMRYISCHRCRVPQVAALVTSGYAPVVVSRRHCIDGFRDDFHLLDCDRSLSLRIGIFPCITKKLHRNQARRALHEPRLEKDMIFVHQQLLNKDILTVHH